MSYGGNVVCKAMELTWAQVEPALPPFELFGRVDELLENPALSVLPECDWVEAPRVT